MKLETVEYDQVAAERELAGAGRSRQQKRRDDPPPAHGGNFHGHAAADEVRRSLRSFRVLRFAWFRGEALSCAVRCVRCAAPAPQPPAPFTPLRRKRHLKGGGAGGDKARLRSRLEHGAALRADARRHRAGAC